MNKRITNDQDKIQLVSRLLKSGAIDFDEALKLIEVEVEKEFVYYPSFPQEPLIPQWPNPLWPTVIYQQ